MRVSAPEALTVLLTTGVVTTWVEVTGKVVEVIILVGVFPTIPTWVLYALGLKSSKIPYPQL